MARSKRNKMKVAIDPAPRESLKEMIRKLIGDIGTEMIEEILNAKLGKKLEKLHLRLLEGGGIPRREPSLRPIILNSCQIQNLMISQSGKNVVKHSKGHKPRRADMVVSRVASRLSELGSDPPSQIEEHMGELKSLSKILKSTIPDQSSSKNVDSDLPSNSEFPSSAPASENQSSVAATGGTASDSAREQHCENQFCMYPIAEEGRFLLPKDGRFELSSNRNIINSDLNGYGDDIDIDAIDDIDDGGKPASGQAAGAVNQQMSFISDVLISTPALGAIICERLEQENAVGTDPSVAEPVEAVKESTEITDNSKADVRCNADYVSIDRLAAVSDSGHASSRDGCSFEEDLNKADCDADGEESGLDDRELDGGGEEKKEEDAETDDDDNNGCHISDVKDDNEGDGKKEEMDSKQEKEKQEAETETADDNGCHMVPGTTVRAMGSRKARKARERSRRENESGGREKTTKDKSRTMDSQTKIEKEAHMSQQNDTDFFCME